MRTVKKPLCNELPLVLAVEKHISLFEEISGGAVQS